MSSISWLEAARTIRALSAPGRIGATVQEAEQAGLTFAFHARSAAIAAVMAWLLALLPWPRSGYYTLFSGAFFLSGYLSYGIDPVSWTVSGLVRVGWS